MQKKIAALTMALLLAFSMALGAAAVEPRYNSAIRAIPKILFSGTTATCGFQVTAIQGSSISVDMRLYRVVGSDVEFVTSWSTQTGTTSLSYSDSYRVSKGSYMVTLDVTVDGPGGSDNIYKTAKASC